MLWEDSAREGLYAGLESLGSFDDSQRWLFGRFNVDAREDLLLVQGVAWPN